MQRELCQVIPDEFLHVFPLRGVQASNAVLAGRIFPNLAWPKPAMAFKRRPELRHFIESR